VAPTPPPCRSQARIPPAFLNLKQTPLEIAFNKWALSFKALATLASVKRPCRMDPDLELSRATFHTSSLVDGPGENKHRRKFHLARPQIVLFKTRRRSYQNSLPSPGWILLPTGLLAMRARITLLPARNEEVPSFPNPPRRRPRLRSPRSASTEAPPAGKVEPSGMGTSQRS